MSEQVKALMTRAAYLVVWFFLGLLVYEQSAQQTIDTYQNALRQHAIAVQNANTSVISFSTQTLNPQEDDMAANQLSSQKAILLQEKEKNIVTLQNLEDSQKQLETYIAAGELDAEWLADAQAGVLQIASQKEILAATIAQMDQELEKLDAEMQQLYQELWESVDQAFDDLE